MWLALTFDGFFFFFKKVLNLMKKKGKTGSTI
jgi:hypothetical protein